MAGKTLAFTLLLAAALLAGGCGGNRNAGVASLRPDAQLSAAAKDGGDVEPIGTEEFAEDSELAEAVKGAILADSLLRAQDIDVEAQDASVTLKGTVDSPTLRERAVELAATIAGVLQVIDALEVRS